MSHDKNGTPIKAGDIVTVECTVKEVMANHDFCICNLETVDIMHPGPHKSTIVVNAKHVLLAKKAE